MSTILCDDKSLNFYLSLFEKYISIYLYIPCLFFINNESINLLNIYINI